MALGIHKTFLVSLCLNQINISSTRYECFFSNMEILESFCFRDLQQLLSWELTGSEH